MVGVVLAMSVSSIFRGIRLECRENPTPGRSRAHLQGAEHADWQHFGVQLAVRANHEWVAIDGKVLRGTQASGEPQSLVLSAISNGPLGPSADPQIRRVHL